MESKLHQRFIVLLLVINVMRYGTGLSKTLSLTMTELAKYQNSSLNVPIKSSVTLYCPNTTVQVYNVDKVQYDNCQPLIESNIQIGHCKNTPLSLNIQGVTLPGSVNYEVGQTYYFAIYDNNKGTGPCMDGYKFSILVYDPNAITSSTSSSTTLPEAYTSVLDVISSVFLSSPSNSFILESTDSEIVLLASSTKLPSIFITPSKTIVRRITDSLVDNTKKTSVSRTVYKETMTSVSVVMTISTTTTRPTESLPSASTSLLVVGSVPGVLVILVIIAIVILVTVVLFKKKKSLSESKNGADNPICNDENSNEKQKEEIL